MRSDLRHRIRRPSVIVTWQHDLVPSIVGEFPPNKFQPTSRRHQATNTGRFRLSTDHTRDLIHLVLACSLPVVSALLSTDKMVGRMRRTGSKCPRIRLWGPPLLLEVKLTFLILVLIGTNIAHAATVAVEVRSGEQPALVLVDGKLESGDGDRFRYTTAFLSSAIVSFRSDGGSVAAGASKSARSFARRVLLPLSREMRAAHRRARLLGWAAPSV